MTSTWKVQFGEPFQLLVWYKLVFTFTATSMILENKEYVFSSLLSINTGKTRKTSPLLIPYTPITTVFISACLVTHYTQSTAILLINPSL